MTRTATAVGMLVMLLGCSSSDAADPGAGGGTSAGGTSAAGPCDGRGDAFTKSMSKSDGKITVSIMNADPAPPARYNNTWVVEVRSDGTPVSDAVLSVAPDMPDHGHGAQAVKVTPQSDGLYELTPLNLFMPGYWEVPIQITLDDQSEAEVVFGFCIQG